MNYAEELMFGISVVLLFVSLIGLAIVADLNQPKCDEGHKITMVKENNQTYLLCDMTGSYHVKDGEVVFTNPEPLTEIYKRNENLHLLFTIFEYVLLISTIVAIILSAKEISSKRKKK